MEVRGPCFPKVALLYILFDKESGLAKGFPFGSASKESASNAGDLGLIPGLGRSPGEGKGYPLQYSGLENSMDCIVQGVAKSRTRLSSFCSHFNILTNLAQDKMRPLQYEVF